MNNDAAREGAGPIIAFKNVTLNFGSEELYAGLDLRFEQGEFLCIVGPSGCGKSTILRLMSGLLAPTAGAIRVRGDRRRRGDDFAFDGDGRSYEEIATGREAAAA